MLANWLFFWNWAGGTPSPSPAPAPAPPNDGGAQGRSKKKWAYEPATEEFWQVRERYLRRFVEKAATAIVHPTPAPSAEPKQEDLSLSDGTILLRQAFEVAAKRAANAQNMVELRAISERLRGLALDISKIEQQNYDRAIALLLLEVF